MSRALQLSLAEMLLAGLVICSDLMELKCSSLDSHALRRLLVKRLQQDFASFAPDSHMGGELLTVRPAVQSHICDR
eukprot:scaffold632537_cov23-Prasinocladus_malaysianus.AAC.1